MSGPKPRQRRAVFERDKWMCQNCGVRVTIKTATVEHIVPKRNWAKDQLLREGIHGPDNLVTWCLICNQAENDLHNKLRRRTSGAADISQVETFAARSP